MSDGMHWQAEGRPIFRTEIFRAMLKAGTPGMKLTTLRKVWGCDSRYGTLTQLFHELEDMVRLGLLRRDDGIGDNIYYANVTSDEYCLKTGDTPLNFLYF